MPTASPVVLMTTSEVSERVGVPEATLRYWHHLGKGPKSAKLGRRRVYREADVNAWLDAAFETGEAK